MKNLPYVLQNLEPIVYNNDAGKDIVVVRHDKNKIPKVTLIQVSGIELEAEVSFLESDPLNVIVVKTNGNFIYTMYIY